MKLISLAILTIIAGTLGTMWVVDQILFQSVPDIFALGALIIGPALTATVLIKLYALSKD